MIYRLTIVSFFSYHGYTGIYDKMHGLTREVDNSVENQDDQKFVYKFVGDLQF